MNRKPKITLDTNCIINAFDSESQTAINVEEVFEILKLALQCKIEIKITTRIESDLNNDKDEIRKRSTTKFINLFEIIGTYSDNKELEEEIRLLLFPNLDPSSKHFPNKQNDIRHLVGHKINGHDIFVTNDSVILKKADSLKKSPGIIVMNPPDCIEHLQRILFIRSAIVAPDSDPKYVNNNLEGIVDFNYSNNNGVFVIGDGIYTFETMWPKASNNSIHSYNDKPSIFSIAIAHEVKEIREIEDATIFDYSSRSRTVNRGQILVLSNINGFFAAIKVIDVVADPNHQNDRVSFHYVIQTDGTSTFTKTS